MKNKKQNIIDLAIVTREAFPVGMAATNRILSYAQVLAKKNKVKVYITKPSENINSIKNHQAKGVINKLAFEYISRTTIWPFQESKLTKLRVLLNGYFTLLKLLKKDKPKTIIIYSSDVILKIMIIYLFKKTKVIIEENEYPKILKQSTSKIKQNFHLYFYKKCDGLMVMTNELCQYYKSLNVKDVFILPMTVDIRRFNKNNVLVKKDYFVYVGGSGGIERDSLESMVIGFHLFLNKHPGFEFHIIGPLDKKNKNVIKVTDYVNKNKLRKSVLFKGIFKSDEIPKILQEATGIVMTPQENFKSGGFPTKLGEFLASGTPVITTNISEISFYLNESNSFIISPGETKHIAKEMENIILNPIKAQIIGSEGQKTANRYFNAETYIKELKHFLNLT